MQAAEISCASILRSLFPLTTSHACVRFTLVAIYLLKQDGNEEALKLVVGSNKIEGALLSFHAGRYRLERAEAAAPIFVLRAGQTVHSVR
jgi:hypothetical protein